MPLSKPQQSVSDCAARFRVLIAGRRFGKSYLAMNELAKIARFPDKRVYYVGPTYRQSKAVMWDLLKHKMQDVRWLAKANESDLTLTLKNNSKISLRGSDNPDSLRGVGLHGIVMDEFAMQNADTWNLVLRPTLSDHQGSALFIGTPDGTQNWSYDLYQRGLSGSDPEWASFLYTTLDGGNVPEWEIEQARSDLDERSFRQEYLATFETYAGQIYYGFVRERNVKPYKVPNTGLPADMLVFCDFNVSPVSAAIAVKVTYGGVDGYHIIDEIVMHSSNTDELVDEINNRYPNKRITAYPDPAGAQRKTSAGGRTDISILENARFTVKYKRAHPAVRDRINAVNSALCSSDGTVRLWIDPRCKNVITCLDKQIYKPGTKVPDKDQGFDHMNDAVGYGIEYLMPIKKDIIIDPHAPQRWGHATGR